MRHLPSFAMLVIVSLLSSMPVAAQAPDGHARGMEGFADVARIDKGRLDAALSAFVDDGKIAGVSALVYQDGVEAYSGHFGLADREAGRPIARDTIVQVFSMTKPVVGVALMQLWEQGRFELDAPVANYLPEFSDLRVYAGDDEHGLPRFEAPLRAPTVRDMLRHTAGLVSGMDDSGPVGALYREAAPERLDRSLAENVRQLATVPLLYQPGTRWLYSPAVDVQARLVEVLSGMSLDAYLRQHVLDPLRMHDTRYTLREADWPRVAALYFREGDGTLVRLPDAEAYKLNGREMAYTPGSWGLTSTLDDYMRFARMLLEGGQLDGARLLRASTVRLMASDALPAGLVDTSWLRGNRQVGFGINVAVRTDSPKQMSEASGEVGEFFWDGAANTLFWVDPVNRIATVLFAQWLPPASLPLHKAFRDAVYADDSSAAAPRQ